MTKRNRQPVPCSWCGATIELSPSRLAHSPRHFCGRECRHRWLSEQSRGEASPTWKGGEITVDCAVCGKSFSLPRFKVARSATLYCSAECMGKGQRKNLAHSPTTDELHDLYVVQRLSMTEIARRLGCSRWVVRRLIAEAGLPVRSRSEWGVASWEQATDERHQAAADRIDVALQWLQDNPDQRRAYACKAAKASAERTGPTSIERAMMAALDKHGIAYTYQYTVGDKFVCDFLIPDGLLIVECDGRYWHDRPEARIRDKGKDAYLRKCGYTVLRFSDEQINQDVHGCVRVIQAHLEAPASQRV